jgi:hypothetical protein
VRKYTINMYLGVDDHVSLTVTYEDKGSEDVCCGGYDSIFIAHRVASAAITRHRKKLKQKEKE